MRILSIILSLFIFALSISPVLGMIEDNTDKRCSTPCCTVPMAQGQSTESGDESSSKGLCNPFTVACSACTGFTLQAVVALSNPIEHIIVEFTFYAQLASQQFAHSIWEPPKVV